MELNLAENGDCWVILLSGALRCQKSGQILNQNGDEAGGYRPYAPPGSTTLICKAEAQMLRFSVEDTQQLLANVPIFNYKIRQYRNDHASRVAVP